MKFMKKLSAVALSVTTVASMLNISAFATDDSYGKFVWGEDNWNFRNASWNFGETYYFTDEDKQALKDNLSNIEYHLAFEHLMGGEFLGACYGMAATSILACYDLIDYSKYSDIPSDTLWGMVKNDDIAYLPDADEGPNDKIRSLCNYYAALQYTDTVRQDTIHSILNETDKERLQRTIDNAEKNIPTLIAMFGDYVGSERYGHAVVAFDVEYGEFDVTEYEDDDYYDLAIEKQVHYDGGRIKVYNNSGWGGYQYLYFNSDLSWTYGDYSSAKDSTFAMAISDVDILNDGGMISGTDEPLQKEFKPLVLTNAIGVEELYKINIEDGKWTATGENISSECSYPIFLGDISSEFCSKNIILPDNESGYVFNINQNDINTDNLDEDVIYVDDTAFLELNYENALFNVQSDNCSQVVFDPSGYIELNGDDSEYEIEMVWNDGYTNEMWEEIQLKGNADNVSLTKTDKGYIVNSDNLTEMVCSTVTDNGTNMINFSTDKNSVQISMSADETAVIKTDEDNDGIYETVITGEELIRGDANSDGAVNVRDCAFIASKLSQGLYDQLPFYTDYNEDDEVNVRDAAAIANWLAESGR